MCQLIRFNQQCKDGVGAKNYSVTNCLLSVVTICKRL